MAMATFELPDDLALMLDGLRGQIPRRSRRESPARSPAALCAAVATPIGANVDPELSGADSEDWLRDHWRPD